MRRVGLGNVNGRYFLFHVGLGFDAAVVAQVERRSTPQALRRPSPLRLRRLRHLVPPLRPKPAPLRPGDAPAATDRPGRRRRLLRHLPEHPPLHLSRQPAPRRGPRRQPRQPAQRVVLRRSSTANMLSLAAVARSRGGEGSAGSARSRSSTDVVRAVYVPSGPCHTRSTATTSAIPNIWISDGSPSSLRLVVPGR